jgi:hypothetical protein
MEWTPQMITTYVDDIFIWAFDISNPSSFDGEEFHKPYFLIVNMAIGGNFPGIFKENDITAPFPATLEVDYIRVYNNSYTILVDVPTGGNGDGGGDDTSSGPPPVCKSQGTKCSKSDECCSGSCSKGRDKICEGSIRRLR